jgi:CrcB protein
MNLLRLPHLVHSPSPTHNLVLAVSVAVAGALGALARNLLNDAMAHRVRSDFPYGILTINLAGSFALGLLTGMALYHGLSTDALLIAGTGVCGGFTTWSTSIWETLQLLRLRLFAQTALHTLGGVAIAVGLAAAGIALAGLA